MNRKTVILGGFCALAALSAPGARAAEPAAKAQLIDLDGKVVGEADFFSTAHGVLIEVAAKALPPGTHAIHIHAAGTCTAQDKFASAGAHFSTAPKATHGYLSAAGSHAGDMPNQVAAGDGTLRASMLNTQISLGSGANSLFDADGSSIIIHAKADDYSTDPSGNAGDRLVCGVIRKQ